MSVPMMIQGSDPLHFPQIGIWSGGADLSRLFAPHCGQAVIESSMS
jgi:hypothetical protein